MKQARNAQTVLFYAADGVGAVGHGKSGRGGKRQKDRRTVLPPMERERLRAHLLEEGMTSRPFKNCRAMPT